MLEFLYRNFGGRYPAETKYCAKCHKPAFPVYKLLDVYVCHDCITEFIRKRTTVTIVPVEDQLL